VPPPQTLLGGGMILLGIALGTVGFVGGSGRASQQTVET
jgi:hypothetical protein